MKKSSRLLLVLAAALILAVTGCGGNNTSVPDVSVPETEFVLYEESDITEDEEPTAEEDDTALQDDPEISDEESDDLQISDIESDDTEKEEYESGTPETEAPKDAASDSTGTGILESDTPTEKDELAAYIHEFGHLPDNFITKNEAKNLGWVNTKGNLWDVAPGCSIGGDYYSNYEKTLPKAPGRKYYECDVGYDGGFRDARRIVFSNDGLIYYTEDHYETFELLYGEE